MSLSRTWCCWTRRPASEPLLDEKRKCTESIDKIKSYLYWRPVKKIIFPLAVLIGGVATAAYGVYKMVIDSIDMDKLQKNYSPCDSTWPAVMCPDKDHDDSPARASSSVTASFAEQQCFCKPLIAAYQNMTQVCQGLFKQVRCEAAWQGALLLSVGGISALVAGVILKYNIQTSGMPTTVRMLGEKDSAALIASASELSIVINKDTTLKDAIYLFEQRKNMAVIYEPHESPTP